MSAPGEAFVREAFSKAFANIESDLKAQLLTEYRHYVDTMYGRFMTAVMSPTSTGEIIPSFGRRSEWRDWRDWMRIDEKEVKKAKLPPFHRFNTWEELRTAPQVLKKDYTWADKEAIENYESAKKSFIEKNVVKITNVLSERSDFQTIYSDFAFRRGVFTGSVIVTMKNGDTFTASVGLKYVIRYIPRVTPYYQYPLLFSSAKIGGNVYRSPSEEELREAFSGVSQEKFAQAKQAQAAAEGWCPGSGSYKYGPRRVGNYRECAVCKQLVSVSSTGKILKHKTREGQKAAEAKKAVESGYCPASRTKVPQDIIDAMGPVEPYKDPKALCRECGQMVRLDARSEWIRDQFTSATGYPTKMKVESATYYKHKLPV